MNDFATIFTVCNDIINIIRWTMKSQESMEEPFHLSVITISVIHTESRCNRHDGDDYTYNDQFQHIFHLIRKIK